MSLKSIISASLNVVVTLVGVVKIGSLVIIDLFEINEGLKKYYNH